MIFIQNVYKTAIVTPVYDCCPEPLLSKTWVQVGLTQKSSALYKRSAIVKCYHSSQITVPEQTSLVHSNLMKYLSYIC